MSAYLHMSWKIISELSNEVIWKIITELSNKVVNHLVMTCWNEKDFYPCGKPKHMNVCFICQLPMHNQLLEQLENRNSFLEPLIDKFWPH